MWDPKRLDEDRTLPPLRTIARPTWEETHGGWFQLRTADGADNATCAGSCGRIIYAGDAIAVFRQVVSPGGGWFDLTFHRSCWDARPKVEHPESDKAIRSLLDRLRSLHDPSAAQTTKPG
jgi:hypothetical protein